MRLPLFLVFTASCCLTLTPTPFQSSSISPTTDAATDWLRYGRTDDEQRFSPLNQINDRNIDKLGLAWSHEFGTARGLEATPLETNGVIYTTGEWSVVYALDARTGQV